MNRKGICRPGAWLMVAAVVLTVMSSLGPLFIAATRPSHEWSLILSGLPALLLSLSGVVILILYVVGFLQYCHSKGYSRWLGVLLLLGNVLGFLVLLMLPDLNARVLDRQSAPGASGVTAVSK